MAIDRRDALTFSIWGPIERTDLPGLCARVCALLERHGPGSATCDASSVPVDAVTVDALARLQLAAGGYGCRIRLCDASPELLALVALMGLEDVLPGAS